MRTPYLDDSVGATPGSLPSNPTIMQIGIEYSTATARTPFKESSKPVYCIRMRPRSFAYESPPLIPNASSSFHTKTCLKDSSTEMGANNPDAVVFSGTVIIVLITLILNHYYLQLIVYMLFILDQKSKYFNHLNSLITCCFFKKM